MASTYLSRTPSSAGNQKTFTFSAWVKRGNLSNSTSQYFYCAFYGNANRYSLIRFTGSDELSIYSGIYTTGGTTTLLTSLTTTRLFRDTSAWYHIVVAVDTTQATSSDRVKIYVNGVQETSFSTETYPSQNSDTFFNTTISAHRVGSYDGSIEFFDGSMSHVHWIDGTAYDASTFGSFDSNGVWKPNTSPSVTYGTNGFFLKFENSSNMDLDSSPNNLTFSTSGNLTQTLDTPSNVYATWNPLDYRLTAIALSYGNTYMNGTNDPSYPNAQTTLAIPKKGKWYAEFKQEGTQGFAVGIADVVKFSEALRTDTTSPYNTSYNGLVALFADGSVIRNGTQTYSVTPSFSSYDIMMIAYDADNGAMYFGRNGTWGTVGGVTSDPTSGASKTGAIDISGQTWWTNSDFQTFSVGSTSSGEYARISANFGNGYFLSTAVSSAGSNGNGSIFEFDCPSGYYALNTKNLATYG